MVPLPQRHRRGEAVIRFIGRVCGRQRHRQIDRQVIGHAHAVGRALRIGRVQNVQVIGAGAGREKADGFRPGTGRVDADHIARSVIKHQIEVLRGAGRRQGKDVLALRRLDPEPVNPGADDRAHPLADQRRGLARLAGVIGAAHHRFGKVDRQSVIQRQPRRRRIGILRAIDLEVIDPVGRGQIADAFRPRCEIGPQHLPGGVVQFHVQVDRIGGRHGKGHQPRQRLDPVPVQPGAGDGKIALTKAGRRREAVIGFEGRRQGRIDLKAFLEDIHARLLPDIPVIWQA